MRAKFQLGVGIRVIFEYIIYSFYICIMCKVRARSNSGVLD